MTAEERPARAEFLHELGSHATTLFRRERSRKQTRPDPQRTQTVPSKERPQGTMSDPREANGRTLNERPQGY